MWLKINSDLDSSDLINFVNVVEIYQHKETIHLVYTNNETNQFRYRSSKRAKKAYKKLYAKLK